MRGIIWLGIAGLLLCAASARSAEAPPKVRLEPVIKGLQEPVHLTHDGTDRLFICEQAGRIRLLEDGALRPEAYLDIVKQVTSGGECGLLSVAFHPKFAENGYLYVNYTTKAPRLRTVISEFTADPKAAKVDPATERVILTIDQPYSNHNGGCIVFGPDGMLYIGMGDGGSANDPQNRAQNPRELLGKMLRIDVTPRQGYAVPKDNPFVGNSAYRPEIWATGMRNPWRFSFDAKTKDLWCGDVGQNLWEEIDILEKGGNYGWNIREGNHPFTRKGAPLPKPPEGEKLIDPVKEYDRQAGQSVTGGHVYRGRKYPVLDGWYFYGDYASGRIWGLKRDGENVTGDGEFDVAIEGGGVRRVQPSSFGEDRAGELYLVHHGGAVYRIHAK